MKVTLMDVHPPHVPTKANSTSRYRDISNRKANIFLEDILSFLGNVRTQMVSISYRVMYEYFASSNVVVGRVWSTYKQPRVRMCNEE